MQNNQGSHTTMTYSYSLKTTARPKNECYCCGRTGHLPSICHFRGQKCRNCAKISHFAKVHNSQEAPSTEKVQQQASAAISKEFNLSANQICRGRNNNEWGIFTVHSKLETNQPSVMVKLIKINNAEVIMELDTGVSLAIMSRAL